MAKKQTPKTGSTLTGELQDLIRELYRDLKKDVLSKIPFLKKRIEKRLRLASRKILGQHIALIGPPASGKTTLLKVLRNPQIEKAELETYKKTGAGEDYKEFSVKWTIPVTEDLQIPYQFKVKAGLDNGGEDYIREGHWLAAIQKSFIIFYLFDFERFHTESFKKAENDRIHRDFDWIGEHVNAFPANFVLIPIANKADRFCSNLAEFRELRHDQQVPFQELRTRMLRSMPKGYHNNIKQPVLMSLYDKRIRNEQFADLMLAVIGDDLVSLIKEVDAPDTNSGDDGIQ